MKGYHEFKDFGVEWLGEIPEHWGIKKLKFIAIINGYTLPEDTLDETEFFYIDIGNVAYGCLIDTPVMYKFKDAPSRARRIIHRGDTILSTVRTYLKAITFIDERFDKQVASTGFAVLSPGIGVTEKYLFYLLSCHFFVENVCSVSVGVSYPATNANDIGGIKVALPPIKEQSRIAEFLDYKIEHIDDLITKKQKLIELLKEERTAIINQAVTKGLDPTAPMRDSGIELLGEIPEQWGVRKIGRSFRTISSGTTPTAGREEFYQNGNIPWVLTGDLNDSILNQTSKSITELAFSSYSALKKYPIGSLVIAMYGATIGKLSILGIEAATNQACCVLAESNLYNNKFMYYWMFANRENIISLGYGGGQPNISQEIIRNLKVPCPSVEEQSRIVEYIDIKCDAIERSLSQIGKEIELISEYKISLINEAVTGKIDVHGYETK